MKRSTTAKLVLMGLAPLLISACDDTSAPETSTQNFTTVDSCVASGVPKATCQTAHDEAVANAAKEAPHFGTREQCVAQYGESMCQQSTGSSGSVWVPLMSGFLIGRMLDSRNNQNTYVPAGPVYRGSGGYYSPGGSVYGGSYRSSSSGWSSGSSSARVSSGGSRAITASRGGFGSMSAMSHGWGG